MPNVQFDAETVLSELPYIRSTQWYARLLSELDDYRRYHMQDFLNCEDQRELGKAQGIIKAVDEIAAKIKRED